MELPGRGERLSEAPVESLGALAASLCDGLGPAEAIRTLRAQHGCLAGLPDCALPACKKAAAAHGLAGIRLRGAFPAGLETLCGQG